MKQLIALLLSLLICPVAHSGTTVKVKLNFDNTVDTAHRDGGKEQGGGDTCITGFTCSALGTATCQFADVSGDQRVTAQTGDGYCAFLKNVASEADLQFMLEVKDSVVWNSETWAGGGILFTDDTATWGTDYRSVVWWAQATEARLRTDETGTPLGQAGLSGTSLNQYLGFQYDASTDEQFGWESEDAIDIEQIGTEVDDGEFSSYYYGGFVKSDDSNSSITMTFGVEEDTTTLDWSDATTPPPAGSPPAGPTISNYAGGPAWPSGAGQFGAPATEIGTWGTWMGRPLDIYVAWSIPIDNWTDFQTGKGNFNYQAALDNLPTATTIVHALPMVPTSVSNRNCGNPTVWDDFAAGDFDAFYTTMAQNMEADIIAHGRSTSNHVIRLGWEMNGDWYPWSICNQVANFKLSWERAVDILRAELPGIIIDFSPARVYPGFNPPGRNYSSGACGAGGCDLAAFLPPADTYDVISRSTHDDSPFTIDQQSWDEAQYNDPSDKDIDLLELITTAKTIPKKIAVSEWGTAIVDCGGSHAQSPEPDTFLQFMYDFLNDPDVVDWVAWDAYFSVGCTQLHSTSRQSTAASIKFKSLWQ